MTPPQQKPRLRIRQAMQDDASAMVEIQLSAFGTDIINQLLYPGEITKDAREKAVHSLFSPPSGPHQNSEPLLVVAELDDSSGGGQSEVIAFAKWCLRRQDVSEGEWNVEAPVSPDMLGEGSNIEVYKWFHETLHRRTRMLVQGDAMLCE